jgi:hypothetical protein
MVYGEMKAAVSLVLLAVVALGTPARAHSRNVLASASVSSDDRGQYEDVIAVRAELLNLATRRVRVRCKVEVTSAWWRDADDDSFFDEASPERYRGVKWFSTRIGRNRSRSKTVQVRVPHPDKGAEMGQYYGNDQFQGWETGYSAAEINHCHRKR